MIQARPHQDEAEFPPFDFADIAPESVLWLDDLFEEETTERVQVRRRRPQLRLQRRRQVQNTGRAPFRLSADSIELLEKAAPGSPLAKNLLRDVSSVSLQVAERDDQRFAEQIVHREPKSLIRKVSRRTKPAVPRELKRIARKRDTEKSPHPTAGKSPGRCGLNRLSPRTDTKGQKRRRRLKRLRSEMLESRTRYATPQPSRHQHAGRDQTPGSGKTTAPASSAGASKTDIRTSGRLPGGPDIDSGRKRAADGDANTRAQKKPQVGRPGPRREEPSVDVAEFNSSDVAGSYRVIVLPPPTEETYSHWFRRVVVRNRWMTWFTTFYLHWVVLLIMAAVIVHGPENAAHLILEATVATDDAPELPPLEVVPTEIEPQPVDVPEDVSAVQESVVTQLAEHEVVIDESVLDVVADDLPAAMMPAEQTDDHNSRESHRKLPPRPNPAPIQAVSEGSFSVWTEPAQPDAGDPYRIIIQIRLPPGVERYAVSDLQGVVIGSDGYRKPIPGSATGDLLINDGYARFVVPIVSADAEVRDTVFIRSKLLKETQKLVLDF